MPTDPSPSTILVTGATGFVAANFVLELAQHGHQVIAYDVNPPIPLLLEYWAPAQANIHFKSGSVTDAARLSEIGKLYAPRKILHAAAITAVDPMTETAMGARMIEVNVMGTVRTLELARQLQAERYIYISSSGVYGAMPTRDPIVETVALPLDGADMYTIAKFASEQLVLRYHALLNLDVAIGRLNGPYGPMERDTGVRPLMSPIYQLATAALLGRTVRVHASNASFDWTYVMDLAKAVRLLLVAPALPNQMYNLSGGVERPLTDVIALLNGLVPNNHLEWVDAPDAAELNLGHVPHRGPLDISRLRDDVGFAPSYDLAQGIAASLPWWRAMLAADN